MCIPAVFLHLSTVLIVAKHRAQAHASKCRIWVWSKYFLMVKKIAGSHLALAVCIYLHLNLDFFFF